MIVFIGGMPRSGSTFCFNVVREVLERRGSVYQEPTSDIKGAIINSADAEHVLVKGHDADQLGITLIQQKAVRAVCTIRKPEDAIASWMDAFGFDLDESIEQMAAWLRMYSQIRRHVLTIDYRWIEGAPWIAAWKIARHVSVLVAPLEVTKIWKRYRKVEIQRRYEELRRTDENIKELNFSYYDAKTFFHRRHVSSLQMRTAEQVLRREQIEQIRTRLDMFLDAKGFLDERKLCLASVARNHWS